MDLTTDVLLEEILLDQSPRVRCEDNEDAIRDYRDAYLRHDRLPAPIVYDVAGIGMLIADGRHRVMAAAEADLRSIGCVLRKGTAEECLACALGANSRHGLRRTNADKRMCAEKAVKQWPKHSDRQIADMVHVGADLVATVRGALVSKGLIEQETERLGLDGKTRLVPVKVQVTSQAKEEPRMPAKRDESQEIEHTQPPPVPSGLRAETVPLILDTAKLLEELWDAHPTWRIPAFRRAIAQLRVIREDLQMEFPGFGETKPRKKFTPPTLEEVKQWCKRDNLPEAHAEEFISFYASKGWKVGVNPMVNAEQAFIRSRTWHSANGKAEAGPAVRSINQKELSRLAAKSRRAP